MRRPIHAARFMTGRGRAVRQRDAVRLTRTGGLLVGAVLAGMLLVDLPIPAGRPMLRSAPPYVPAADSWIEPGAASRHEAPPRRRPWIPAEPAHHADRRRSRRLHRVQGIPQRGRPASTRLSGRSDARTVDAVSTSEHRRVHAVGRIVAVEEGLDVDDHLLAHVDAAFDRGRAHVRQRHDAVAGQRAWG